MSKAASYREDLKRIEADIASLRGHALTPPVETESATKYLYRIYQRASLTASFGEFDSVIAQVDSAIPCLRFPGDLYLIKANLSLKLHRLGDVKQVFEDFPALLCTPDGQGLQADLDFQEGRYEEARCRLRIAIESDRTWDNLARLAHLSSKLDGPEQADALYAEAIDELTAKQMRSYAWVELQRGALDLAWGRTEDARQHYVNAAKAYPGYWLTDEHVAGLFAAEGKLEEAAATFELALRSVSKPELKQTLGQVYEALGCPERAKPLYAAALGAYRESAGRGGVHYYHHLVHYYTEVEDNPPEALRWAREDVSLRSSFSTEAALAWALFRNGEIGEAARWMTRALESGVREEALLRHASEIYSTVARRSEAERCLRLANAMKPHSHAAHFHAH